MTQEEFFKRYQYDVTEDRIGGGGFGTVYKAKDNVLHRTVAIKVSEVKTTADGQKTFSLKDEFEALNHVPKHPNIANYEEFYSFESPQGIFDYAVMQYYPDGNLSTAIKQGLTAEQKEDIATQLLEGIAFLHEHKVVHRDLKPGNILIVRDGESIIPLITDFGLSKAANLGDGSLFSNSFGGGTQRYSSPEQLQGKPLRLNTDLWSYGAILYELFTSEQLFSAGSGAANSAQADLEIYNKIVNGDVRSLGGMPEKWRKVAERCLVVDADKRAKDEAELLRIVSGEAQEDETVANTGAIPNAIPSSSGPHSGLDPLSPKPKDKPSLSDDEGTQVANNSQPKVGPSTGSGTSNDKPKSKKALWIALAAAAVAALVAVLVMNNKGGNGSAPLQSTEIVEEPVNGGDLTISVNGVSFVMKPVEGGTFQMGSNDSDANDNEKPVHSVTVNSFYMGETEVTQALWKAVMGDNPSRFKGDNLPVEEVSWNDCQEFIRKLNGLTGRNFRLPTEAEWECAARGGSRNNGTKYAGSSSIGSVAWYSGNSGSKTHSVKGKSPNELGLYDMCGNVSEWCSDWFSSSYYSSTPSSNPKGPSSGSYHVLRGGRWDYYAWECGVSNRDYGAPGCRYCGNGFRLALSQ